MDVTALKGDKQAEGLMNQAFYPIDLQKDDDLSHGRGWCLSV
jgi:hypothetical protein